MPAPPNDNRVDAILLPSVEEGSVVGTNNGATAEVGEFINNGRTVWYKWIAPSTKGFYFNTRWNGGIGGQQTDFAAIIDITDAGVNPIVRGLPNVFNYERRVRLFFSATAGATYYIRIDSDASHKTGNFLLWWELAAELFGYGCDECPPDNMIGSVQLACFRLNVFSEQFIVIPGTDQGAASSGRYVLRYCSGAWNYGHPQSPATSWVVSRVPQLADQAWPGQDKPGYFFAIQYRNPQGAQVAVLPEPQPAAYGYATPAAAALVSKCTQVEMQHNGLTPMVAHFTDELYNDNTLTDPALTPLFEIVKAVPHFVPGTSCGIYDPSDLDPVTNRIYLIEFPITNYGEFDFTQLRPSISGPGITQNGLAARVDIPANKAPPGGPATTIVRVSAHVTQLHTVATLQLTPVNTDMVKYPTLTYDISPKPDIVSHGIFKIAGPDWVGEFQKFDGCSTDGTLTPFGGLPTRNLVAIFEESGGVSNIRDRLGNPTTTIPIDNPTPGTGDSGGQFGIKFTPTPVGVSSVTFTITAKDLDSGITYPPIKLTQPCPV
jgi:hypothetical protein